MSKFNLAKYEVKKGQRQTNFGNMSKKVNVLDSFGITPKIK